MASRRGFFKTLFGGAAVAPALVKAAMEAAPAPPVAPVPVAPPIPASIPYNPLYVATTTTCAWFTDSDFLPRISHNWGFSAPVRPYKPPTPMERYKQKQEAWWNTARACEADKRPERWPK